MKFFNFISGNCDVLLDRDLMTAPEAELFKIKVLMTLIGGEIVYNEIQKYTAKE